MKDMSSYKLCTTELEETIRNQEDKILSLENT